MGEAVGAVFGKACVERGWLTRVQLAEWLRVCDGEPDLASALSSRLVSRGLAPPAEVARLEESVRRLLDRQGPFAEIQKEDAALGQTLVEAGAATKERILEALSLQEFASKRGSAVPRLAEILLEKGDVAFAPLESALRNRKSRVVLRCSSCQASVAVTDFDEKKTYLCRECANPLAPPAEARADVPEEAARAGQNPKNVLGKFIAVRELGRGGMGAVHKAWDAALKRWVALKVLMNVGSEDDVLRFEREAQTAAAMRHPGIVGIFEVTEVDGKHAIAMEYIDGRTLAGRKIPWREACQLMIQVARAVDYAHSRGIVHRDIKPHNVMLDAGGKAYVMDFGLAKSLRGASSITIEGTVVGTPSYMAPEQAAGNISQIDQRSDIYSMGAVLYELLTGRPPFRGDSAVETLSQVVHKPPLPPSRLNPQIPKDLETVVLKAMEKDKARRYPLARAFAHDLERVLGGRPVARRQPSITRKLGRRVRRNKPAVLAVASAAAAARFVAAFIGLRGGPSEAPPAPGTPPPAPSGIPSERKEAQRDFDAGQRLLEQARLDLYRPGADLAAMRSSLEQAVREFTKALLIYPRYHEAHLGRGQAQALLQRPHAASEDFAKAIEIVPAYPAAFSARGRLRLEQYIDALSAAHWVSEDAPEEAERWREEARADLVRAIELGAPPEEAEFLRATAALAAGEPARAVELFDRLLNGGSKKEEYYYLRAVARNHLAAQSPARAPREELRRQALADLAEALGMRVNYHEAYRFRGAFLFLSGRHEEALADFRSGLRLNPQDSRALSDLGTYYQRHGDAAQARDHFDRALAADPANFRAWTNRGVLRMNEGDLQGGLRDTEEALKINPQHLAARYNLAAVLDRLGDTKRALLVVEALLAARPAAARGYYLRGNFRYKLGFWEKALGDLEKAASLDPEQFHAPAQPLIAACKDRLGQK